MREILFRAKANSEVRDGEWVYGSLLAESQNTFPIIARDYDNDEDWISVIEWDTVDSTTIGQFTGLYDKNGKRIFEGDIIYMGLFPFIVKYDIENARYMLFASNGSHRDGFNIYTMETHEVIGNIHDNPEILKESEDTE